MMLVNGGKQGEQSAEYERMGRTSGINGGNSGEEKLVKIEIKMGPSS